MYMCAHEGVVVSDCVRPSQCIYEHMYCMYLQYCICVLVMVVYLEHGPTQLHYLRMYIHTYVHVCVCMHMFCRSPSPTMNGS